MKRAHLLLALLLLGCSGDGSTGGDRGPGDGGQRGGENGALKPCPPKGLGVETAAGRPCGTITDVNDPDLADCLGQMSGYKDYACGEPQICPDTGYVTIPEQVVGSAPYTVSITLTNCSTGSKKLLVAKTEMEGDPRCSFAFDPAKDLSLTEVAPGGSAVIETVYAPAAAGEDHAALGIYSNAENFPGLALFICGRAVQNATGNPPSLTCQDPGGQIAACHK